MGLLNYTTTVPAERTIGEIMAKLAKAGARQIMHGYDANGNCTELAFKINTKWGEVAFLLPANINAVDAILRRQMKRIRNYDALREQATRVGWRILKDWVEAQLALIETGMVSVEQVFLPFAQDDKGQTVYEFFEKSKFKGLALMEKTNVVEMKEAK